MTGLSDKGAHCAVSVTVYKDAEWLACLRAKQAE